MICAIEFMLLIPPWSDPWRVASTIRDRVPFIAGQPIWPRQPPRKST